LSTTDIHIAENEGSSDAFSCKKRRIFRDLWCVRTDNRERIEPVQTFCGEEEIEGVNFSRFCADVFYGWAPNSTKISNKRSIIGVKRQICSCIKGIKVILRDFILEFQKQTICIFLITFKKLFASFRELLLDMLLVLRLAPGYLLEAEYTLLDKNLHSNCQF